MNSFGNIVCFIKESRAFTAEPLLNWIGNMSLEEGFEHNDKLNTLYNVVVKLKPH